MSAISVFHVPLVLLKRQTKHLTAAQRELVFKVLKEVCICKQEFGKASVLRDLQKEAGDQNPARPRRCKLTPSKWLEFRNTNQPPADS